MRIDKFLKVSRLIKRRTVANEVADAGRIVVNGREVKASYQVKVGDEVRSVVSGIAKYYTPEEMVGKKVVLVTNLKPVKLCGVKSEGMILCAEDSEGNLSLLSPEKSMESGAKIR